MQAHALSNVVKIFTLISIIQITVFAQTKIYDFEKVDSLDYPYHLVMTDGMASGMATRINDTLKCRRRLVAYNLTDGKILYEKRLDSIANMSCFSISVLNYSVSESKSKMLLSVPSQDWITILEFDYKGHKLIEQQDSPKYYVGGTYINSIDDNEFNSLFILSQITDSTSFGLQSYRYVNNGTSLERYPLWQGTTIRNANQKIISLGSQKFTSVLVIYQKASVDTLFKDSLSAIEMYKYNNVTNTLEHKMISFDDYNYSYVSRIDLNGRYYIITQKIPISEGDKVPRDGKYVILEYKPESNSIETVKELNFKSNDIILGATYDKYTNQFIYFGTTVRSPDRIYIDTYTDYWIANTDTDFNIINQKNFEQSNNDFLGEFVNNVQAIEEGLIIYKTEYNQFTFGAKKVMSLYGRDILSSIDTKTDENELSVFPNPVKSNILHIESADIPYDYQIIDVTGRDLMSGNDINSKTLNIDVSKLPIGCYFLKVNGDVQKIIKTH